MRHSSTTHDFERSCRNKNRSINEEIDKVEVAMTLMAWPAVSGFVSYIYIDGF